MKVLHGIAWVFVSPTQSTVTKSPRDVSFLYEKSTKERSKDIAAGGHRLVFLLGGWGGGFCLF